MSDNVKVAVRVRPFRERNRGAKLVIGMDGNSTTISSPSSSTDTRTFTFDYSYWSHDGYKELEDGYLTPVSSEYADQKCVFNDLGRGVLDNAWNGYNCSLFAYGQTGSGKSYSMVGYGVNKGIVPVTCEELFQGIEKEKSSQMEFQVVLSMLEIYNEQVRDLLSAAASPAGGLKIRENPKKGFYVEQLSSVAVLNYKEIEDRIAEGTKNRTIASTNMNATSSRAHTIVAVTFTQKSKAKGGMTRSSVINLVDLAGSERAESTGATGARLQEGAAINKSLSTLGNVIKALADMSTGKKVLVPFRDSVLTKLLKNALGGNSKTIMIAALSPADINYDETLSTLRFADRAKSIKTKAVVNESETDKLIRELREENSRLQSLLKKGAHPITTVPGTSDADAAKTEAKMQAELAELMEANKREMEELQKSWEEKLAESQQAHKERDIYEEKQRQEQKTTPHLWNLNEDPQLTGMVVHLIKAGVHRIGNRKATPPPDILINGLSIQEEHATVENKNGAVKLTAGDKARILVNGEIVNFDVVLHHNDRILFGSSNLYVFYHPKELQALVKAGSKPATITYDTAQEEVAVSSGLYQMGTEGKTKEDIDLVLREDLVTIMPMLHEANAMSEELNKKVMFEIVLVSPQARGLKEGRTEVKVKMRHLVTDHEWVWNRNQFLDRKYRMQEMYQNYVEGEEWNLPQEQDPFWETTDTDVHIGSVHVYLQSLGYNIELQEELAITDFKGNELGQLKVEVLPCKPDGSLPTSEDDLFVEIPENLIGEPMHFMLKIACAKNIPVKFTKGIHCRFKLYLDSEQIRTEIVSDTRDPCFHFTHHFSMTPVTQHFLDYLKTQPLIIEVWARQVDSTQPNASNAERTTKQLVVMETMRRGSMILAEPAAGKDDQYYHMMCELSANKKQKERLSGKIKKLQALITEAKKENRETLSVEAVEKIVNAETPNFKAVATVVALSNRGKTFKKIQQEHAAEIEKAARPESAACVIM